DQLSRVVARDGLAAQTPEMATLYAQLLVRDDREEELATILSDPRMPLTDLDRWSLRADLLNPHRMSPHLPRRADHLPPNALAAAEDRWLAVFNETFAADGLESVRLL